MKAVGTKLDKSMHEKVMERCNTEGVCVSEYLRNLISKDLNGQNTQNRPTPQAKVEVLSATTNRDIPLVKGIEVIAYGARYDNKGNYLGQVDNSGKPLKRVEVKL